MKAANHGSRTPISYIKDGNGNIDLAFLKMQPHYKVMLEQGWEFVQRPWLVEAAWPAAPDVLRRALNSTSELHSCVTELEGAVTIAECLEAGEDERAAIDTACSGNPSWLSYAATLAELAKKNGGGERVPLLHKLDRFAKKHGDNRKLGEEFLGAVVHGFKFADPLIQLPRVVDMLITTNMVAPKVVDGVARCLTKTDVQNLSTTRKLPLLKELESHLAEAEKLCGHVLRDHPMRNAGSDIENTLGNIEGLFKVRLGAHVCKKGKQTFEARDYDDAHDIVRRFFEGYLQCAA